MRLHPKRCHVSSSCEVLNICHVRDKAISSQVALTLRTGTLSISDIYCTLFVLLLDHDLYKIDDGNDYLIFLNKTISMLTD